MELFSKGGGKLLGRPRFKHKDLHLTMKEGTLGGSWTGLTRTAPRAPPLWSGSESAWQPSLHHSLTLDHLIKHHV